MFTWYRNWQRQRLLQKPFPPEWERWLHANCRHFDRLNSAEQQRLRHDVQLFDAEKHWEGCNGLIVTDEMRVTIAAHVAVLGLGFTRLPFDRLLSILIYPDAFVSRQVRRAPWGGIEEGDEPRLGEAWYQGPVVLSWREITDQCRQATSDDSPGRNVIIHEFAHLLDMQNREVDGIPDLDDSPSAVHWVATFQTEYGRLIRQAKLGRNTVLDYYGATSPAEFFAVGSEAFFERPVQLREESPDLYGILREYYRQDPASRW